MKNLFIALIRKIGASGSEYATDDLESVSELFRLIIRYVDRVFEMETGVQLARFQLEADAFRIRVMELDSRRKMAHDAVIAMMAAVNRMAAAYGAEPPCIGTDDREAIGNWCMAVVKDFFDGRKPNEKDIDSFVSALAG